MGEEDEPGTGAEKPRHPGEHGITSPSGIGTELVLACRNTLGIQNPSFRFLRPGNAQLPSLKSSGLALVTPSTCLSSVR